MRDRHEYGSTEIQETFLRFHPWDPWSFASSQSYKRSHNRCQDYAGPQGRDLVVSKEWCSPITWQYDDPGVAEWLIKNKVFNGGPNGFLSPDPSNFNENLHFWAGDTNSLAVRVAASTNPSKPLVSVPAFIGELKDIPSAVYKRGRQGLSWAATDSLGVRFGILPMVSDVIKLASIAEYTDRLDKNLSNLAKKGGLRRRVKMGSYKNIEVSEYQRQGVHTTTHWQLSGERWGVIRWKPDESIRIPVEGTMDRVNLIRGLLTGTSKYNDKYSYLSDAWELVPWSWLIDWAGGLGTYLDANRNQLLAHANDIWIMTHREMTVSVETDSGTQTSYLETKERRKGTITPSAVSSYMSGDRAATLSGLFIRSPSPIPVKFQ